ncbi:D-alanyl-D-alanine carboxypeptidase [Streptomyces sp. NBC_00299]|uniref:D-alanyl-D-alanine carboxypeptidase n=1 Tax=Streptomyces sp. NBC_00299 TaxID=2975705 RepID=UPI002E2D4C1C|nr:D-alanyl-D-alanine carboxypeptidase [Streptomyces sp. NBC_00299]
MAGESPDRSKQRESSAEPTSGSAVPVPEPEGSTRQDAGERSDPRLAVAREATAPRGGVDTATRVLSRQELDAVRTRLEEAGGTAEDAEGGDATADSTEGGDGTADSTEGGDGTADDAEGTDTSADDAASTDATADSTVGGDATADDAEGTDTSADSTDGADTSADGTKSADATADSAEGTDATADDPREAGSAGDAETETESSTAEGTVSDGAEGASVENAKAEAEDAGSAEDSSEGADAADAEGKAEDEDAVDASDSGAPAEGDDRLRAAVAAWVASSDGDEAEGEAEEASKGETAADADGGAEPAEASDAGSDDSPEAAEGDAPDDADDAPAAADGEDAPQGPPAVDDESRTGGAGGNAKGEGKAKPVDQPTAVFKTVRPAKQPPVDQPTTTLKAPAPETPSERTSKFVALKPDIKPDTPKPPAPAPARTPETPKAPAPDATAVVPQIGPERTTQQPLPPRPPLDLLAELTNTPPPPDTPVRTAIRRVKIWTPLVLLLAIVFAVVQNVRPLPAPTLDLTAKDSYTFEGGKVDIPWPAEGQAALDVDGIGSFGSSGEQKPVPIASVAKVMTAYLILRDHPLKSGDEGPKIKIDQAAEDQSDAGQESTVKVTAGDQITQREALESILIASANNVARLLARWDAGAEKAFVEKMNAAAEGLGMSNTTYTDPSGLNNTTVSTAVDQVKLAKAAMKYPAFREVAAMMSYDDYKGVNHGNWNQLVGRNNVVGIKTGTTTSALGNLVFAAKKEIGGETRTVIGAVVRQPDAGSGILAAALDSGDQLIRAAQDTLESATILKKGDVVGYVDDGLGGRTPVVATKDVKAVGWSGLKVKLTFAPDEVPHTATAGTKVGTLTVGDGSSGAVKIPVALQSDLTEPGFTDKLTRIT